MTRDRDLLEALRRAGDIDPAARERSWRVVRAAHADGGGRPVVVRRRRRMTPLLAAAVLGLAVLAGATAAAAPHIRHLIRSVLGTGSASRHPAPALRGIPGGGRLLVQTAGGTWVVSADGHRRRLGSFAGAAWSPHGLFVVAWHGRELTALTPTGAARWTLSAPAPIAVARWAPGDGFRIAYVTTGGALRVVNGDGTGDHGLTPARAGVAPAWRPGAEHVLAYVDRAGRVNVVAVDTRAVVGRSAPLGAPAQLQWSPGGRRLVAVTPRRIVVLAGAGAVVASRAIARGVAVRSIAWSPRGGLIALSRTHSGTGDVVLLDSAKHLRQRTLLSGPGRFGALAWSPNGGRLLVAWPATGEWLFVGVRPGVPTRAVAGIARAFAPGATAPRFPGAAQWCCAR